ncbi:MAG TPA: PHP domain-containing protein [Kofleriaceae bacterium]|jgi:DNA polymerase (family 10)
MEPAAIANQLRELAAYYELDGDKHRAGAYARAAASVESAQGIARLAEEGRLEELPNIGPSSARVIVELVARGTTDILETMRAKWPPVVIELAQLPRVGAQKARAIWQAMQPADLDAVAAMARAGALRTIKGLGASSEAKILESIEQRREVGARAILDDAEPLARSIASHLRGEAELSAVELAGGVRRGLEVVDELVFAVACADLARGVDATGARLRGLTLLSAVDREPTPDGDALVVRGRLADGMRVAVHVATTPHFGWTHLAATGAAAHVAQLRARVTGDFADEASIYAAAGVPFVPPECRDGTDELGEDFSDLVTLAQLTCAFHCHTTASDGRATLVEMASAAAERGFTAITITDHSAAAGYAGGLDAGRLRAQAAEIAATASPVRILHGTEADILEDGSLDVPPDVLPQLDLVIASIHQRFGLDEAGQTDRIIRAMRAPHFKIWGHALGRLLLRREPVAAHLPSIFAAIAESRAAIELNGDPHRMDLAPEHALAAARLGIPFVLSSDAHSTAGIGAVRHAVTLARRARLRPRQILNTLPPDELAARIRPI